MGNSLNITYVKAQINKIIVTGFINEKCMHDAIIDIYIYIYIYMCMYFSQHNEL